MPLFHESSFPAHDVKSLAWNGDTLVDWVQGGSVYYLDGTVQQSQIHYAYRFDAATVSPTGAFIVLYERCGTKGIILDDQRQIVREINRSFYQANVYDYPIVLWRLPDGREVIAHCPDHYNRLEIEDIRTGERLTDAPERKPIDMLFSRLQTDLSGTYLLSGGWVWQPWDMVSAYLIADVLRDPHLLDGYGVVPQTMAEASRASFGFDQTLIIGTSNEDVDDPDATDTERLADPLGYVQQPALAVYDLVHRRYRSVVSLNEPVGAIMPVTARYVISFYHHPKLLDVSTGHILHCWEHLETGNELSSIIWGRTIGAPLALDIARNRFAVACNDSITIVALDHTLLE